ncbi:MAG: hypothetical protein CVU57_11730 [Deltaproteobacteria bacterium HGW-Deltaproteobacteria-15]|jgi:hypothetical protein|nr:MAG: hypothetical protein CVU57_11730 [Deltaproteobacteria bacterium HGW-Deltaproteobacteria-15]
MSRKHPRKMVHSAPSLSPDDEARVNSLLEDISRLEPSAVSDRLGSPRLAAVFVERIPLENPGAINFMVAIQESFPQKEVQKAVRKGLFRLKQRGVDVPERRKDDRPAFVAVRQEGSQSNAYVSPPDGLGNRAVFIQTSRIPAGVDLAMGVVSDEKGMQEFVFGRYSKRKAREMRDFFFQSVGDLLETSLEHAATLLESAYHKSKTGPNRATSDYLRLRPWLLEKASLLKAPIVYELIPINSLADPAITDSQIDKLLGHKWMETWIVHPDEIKPLIQEILSVQQSPILVSAEQKGSRIQDLKEGFVSKIYTDEKRALTRARLEEIAYLFYKAGEEDYAVLALKAALSVREKDSTFKSSDFLRHLVEHSLSYYLGRMEENRKDMSKEEPASRLILP